MWCIAQFGTNCNLKREKHPWWSVTFIKVAGFTKSNTPSWLFFTFFKLYKWYQIAQNPTFIIDEIWDKIFKNGPSKIVKAVFYKFYRIHSWILCPIYIKHKKIWILVLGNNAFNDEYAILTQENASVFQ